MPKYIKATEAAEAIAERTGISLADLVDIFAAVHPADVTEVRRGEWKNVTGDGETAVCSLCGTFYDATPLKEQSKECFEAFKQFYNFCPNCGADMRGKEKAE